MESCKQVSLTLETSRKNFFSTPNHSGDSAVQILRWFGICIRSKKNSVDQGFCPMKSLHKFVAIPLCWFYYRNCWNERKDLCGILCIFRTTSWFWTPVSLLWFGVEKKFFWEVSRAKETCLHDSICLYWTLPFKICVNEYYASHKRNDT